jgi:hypothetical protein
LDFLSFWLCPVEGEFSPHLPFFNLSLVPALIWQGPVAFMYGGNIFSAMGFFICRIVQILSVSTLAAVCRQSYIGRERRWMPDVLAASR